MPLKNGIIISMSTLNSLRLKVRNKISYFCLQQEKNIKLQNHVGQMTIETFYF